MKSRLDNVHGCKETHKPEQLYHGKIKKITEMEIEEIKKELQDNQRGHVNQSKRKQLEQLCTMYVGVQKQHSAPTTEEKWKIINSGRYR
jgi:hypothetical protein